MGYKLTWTANLGAMRDYGPSLQLKVHCGRCDTWEPLDLDEWAQAYGWEFSFWGWVEACETCGHRLIFLCSPSAGTPLLPMKD